MGYFSNGSAGDCYESKFCQHCVHYGNCAVWDLHMIHNYEDCNKPDSYLHFLIPIEGISNKECRMFVKGDPDLSTAHKEKLTHAIHPAYRDWAAQRGLV